MVEIKPEARRPGSNLFDPRFQGKECVAVDCTAVPPGRRFYCETHQSERAKTESAKKATRAAKAPRQKAERVQAISDGAPEPPKTGGNKGDEKKLADWLGMVLVMMTYVVGLRAAGGQGLLMRGADKELATRLAMTDAQADNVARVAAKKLAPTRIYKRAGKQVIETLDLELIAALESVWEWASTVAPYLRHRGPTIVNVQASYQGSNHNGTQQPTASPLGSGRPVAAHRLDN